MDRSVLRGEAGSPSQQFCDRQALIEYRHRSATVNENTVGRDAELAIDRGQDVVVMDRSVLRDFRARVAGAQDVAGLQAAAREHDGEDIAPVIASGLNVDLWRAAKLGNDGDQRGVEQPA